MSARPTDVAFLVEISDHADMEHEAAPVVSDPQADYHEALRELLRLKRKQREMIAEAGRLGDMAKWAEYRIEVALAKGATP